MEFRADLEQIVELLKDGPAPALVLSGKNARVFYCSIGPADKGGQLVRNVDGEFLRHLATIVRSAGPGNDEPITKADWWLLRLRR